MASLFSRGTSFVADAEDIHSTSCQVSPLTADLPCNETGTDFKTLANQALATVLAEVVKFDHNDETDVSPESWRLLSRKKGCCVYYKTDKFTQQRVMISEVTVQCDMAEAMDYLLDPNTRFKFDNTVKENFELEKFDDNITFNYISMQTRACTLNYSIDICYLTTRRAIEDKSVIAYCSILDNPYAPSTASFKRAWMYHSGFVLEKCKDDENMLKIYYLIHVDIRIHELPETIKNSLLERQSQSLVHLKEQLENEHTRLARFKSSLSLSDNAFPLERASSVQSLEINLEMPTSLASTSPYKGPIKRNLYRSNSENSSEIPMDRDKINSLRGQALSDDRGSHPDLCFWSLEAEDLLPEPSLGSMTDYVTMANSAAASVFREYINVLEAIRFSSVCPEKLSWKILEKQEELWTLEKCGSSIQCMAGVANIRASEREITDFLIDPRSRFSYDTTLNKTYVVDEINDDLRIIYAHHMAKHCFIGHGRDLLYFQFNRKEGEKRILAHASCSHPKCPINPDFIRSKMYETGFIIERLPETGLSSVVYIVKMDLGGTIPAGLVKWIKRKQPKILGEIKKYFER